ncbi:hypothetical protein DFH07DRAFT_774191 [Mycena maculata]|uniref:Uncharacterized protein n=1 Tax=Mycena maculata TaxID=230809 RepID=A0AAD7J0A8_9AGAR|nr:hypothetical protein DFH07DRAFT_774191 [Mycena maculata]
MWVPLPDATSGGHSTATQAVHPERHEYLKKGAAGHVGCVLYSCCLRMDNSRVALGDTQERVQGLNLIDVVEDTAGRELDALKGEASKTCEDLRRSDHFEGELQAEFYVNEVNGAEPSRSAKKTRGEGYERTAEGAGKRGTWWEEREMISERAEDSQYLFVLQDPGNVACFNIAGCGCQHTPDSRTAGSIPTWSDNIVSDPGNPVTSCFHFGKVAAVAIKPMLDGHLGTPGTPSTISRPT